MWLNGGQPVAHVRAHADNVAVTTFASRVLYINAVAGVARFRPGHDHVAGQIETTDDDIVHISS